MNIIHLLLIALAIGLYAIGSVSITVAALAVIAIVLFGSALLEFVGISVPVLFEFPLANLFSDTLAPSIQKYRGGAVQTFANTSATCACSN